MRAQAGRALGALTAVGAAVALAGCGSNTPKGPGTLPPAQLTVGVKAALAQKFSTPPKNVVCPHGLLASQGATTSCTITGANGNTQEVLVTATTIVGNHLNYTLKLGDQITNPKSGQSVTGKTS